MKNCLMTLDDKILLRKRFITVRLALFPEGNFISVAWTAPASCFSGYDTDSGNTAIIADAKSDSTQVARQR